MTPEALTDSPSLGDPHGHTENLLANDLQEERRLMRNTYTKNLQVCIKKIANIYTHPITKMVSSIMFNIIHNQRNIVSHRRQDDIIQELYAQILVAR